MSDLLWVCHMCGRSVKDGDGYLTVSFRAIHGYQRRRARGEAGLHNRPRWRVLHAACDPTPSAHSYAYAIERVRTREQLLARDAHLAGKPWINDTRWDVIAARATREAPSTRSSPNGLDRAIEPRSRPVIHVPERREPSS